MDIVEIIIPDAISQEFLNPPEDIKDVDLKEEIESSAYVFNKRLIKSVRKHRVIYDARCKDFSNLKAKEKAWEEIASRLKSEVDFCKNTWIDIRYSYQKYVRKLRKFLLDGNRVKCKKRPVMVFERELLFLWRFIPDRRFLPNKMLHEVKTNDATAKTNAPEEDDVVLIVEENPIIVIDVDAEPAEGNTEQNRYHMLRITPEIQKFIELLKDYPELYDTDHIYYNDYHRKGIIWNALANELKDKATKLMKFWIYLQTRYEWETYLTPSNANTQLEEILCFLRPYILKNPNTVYKQSFYLKTSWQEPIENFKSIFQLLAVIRRYPRIINYTNEDLLSPDKGKDYHNTWLEISRIRECPPGQCEVTWLILRFFYFQLIEMRQHTYQLQDKWYFETIISEFYSNPVSRTLKPSKDQANASKCFHDNSFAMSTPIIEENQKDEENNCAYIPNTQSLDVTKQGYVRINNKRNSISSPSTGANVLPAQNVPTANVTSSSSKKSKLSTNFRIVRSNISTATTSTNTRISSPPPFTIQSVTSAANVKPTISCSNNAKPPVHPIYPAAMPPVAHFVNCEASVLPNSLLSSSTYSTATNSTEIISSPQSGPPTISPCSSSYNDPSSPSHIKKYKISKALTNSNTMPSPTFPLAPAQTDSLNSSIAIGNQRQLTVVKRHIIPGMKRKAGESIAANANISQSMPPPSLVATSDHEDNISLPTDAISATDLPISKQPTNITNKTASTVAKTFGSISSFKMSSAVSSPNSNEIIVELVDTSYGNQLVVHGPPLAESYAMSMEMTAKFIREIMAIPSLHNKFSTQSTNISYWQYLSNLFGMPNYICKACWSFLSENFSHFHQIAPMEELMKPFTTALDVWKPGTALFQHFEILADSKGWSQYKYVIPDIINDISTSSDALDSDIDLKKPFLEQLSWKYPDVPEIYDIWRTLKNLFLRYMKDLERSIENRWPPAWSAVLSSLRFLLNRVYPLNEPFYYIIRNKINEEIIRCQEIQSQAVPQEDITLECSGGSTLSAIDIKEEKMRSFSAVEIYTLMVYIQGHSQIYTERDEWKRLEAWQEVAKKMKASVHACRAAFTSVVKEYFRYAARDPFDRCKLNKKYFEPIREIQRSFNQQNKSVQKLNIKTPSQLNESVMNNNADANDATRYTDHFIMNINMSNAKTALVMKNWSNAVGTLTLSTQYPLEGSLRSLFKKYHEQRPV